MVEQEEEKINRTDEQKAKDYTNMGSSVTVVNNVIAGDVNVIGDMTEARRKEKVSNNVESLESMVALDDWDSEDMTAVNKAITDGKAFVG
jgi:NDP-sugar pyrophosphorylase family protein